jgi:hypothetical protein
MATRSSISIKTSKTGGKTIYCHWDGYPSNNGKMLKEHYNTEAKVLELMALGNLSILGESIGKKVKFDGFDSQKNPQCLAYGRDRGETEQEASNWTNKPTDLQEYNYLFKDGKWYVSRHDNNRYYLLTDKMINRE